MKPFLIFAAVYGMLAVIFGAFGAHALKERLTADQLNSWEVGVRYQMFHALALFAVVFLMEKGHPGVSVAGWLFIVGVLLFSGSIYLLSFGIGPRQILGPITPLGGLALIAGWGVILFRVVVDS